MKPLLLAALLAALAPAGALAAPPAPPAAVIAIPGGAHGIGFDDIGFAAPLDRVTIPAGATGNLVLLDPATRAATVIAGVSAAHAGDRRHDEGTTSAVAAEGYLFASNHDPAEVVTLDPRTRTVLARTPLAGGPDYVRYVARTHEIWVTEPDRHQIEVFRLALAPKPALTPETTIAIPGGPESLVIDDARDRAYANLWKSTTVEIDVAAHRVVAQWPNTCGGSRGLALDAQRDHLFVACTEGKVVTLAPGEDGRVLASAPAGAGIDIISYAAPRQHLYVPGARAATLTVFDVAPSGALRPLATYRTAAGAHCVTSDDAGHVFVCDPRGGDILAFDDP